MANITFKSGGLRESLRSYRRYKQEWQARMETKLAKMEEEIKQAKFGIVIENHNPNLHAIIQDFDEKAHLLTEDKPA